MDKNTITGLVLMGLLLIGFSWWSQPSSEQKAEMMRQALQGDAQDIVLQNEKLQLTLNTKGGTVTKAVIKGFKDKEGNRDVTLLDEKVHRLNFTLSTKDANIATQDLFFQPSAQTDSTVTLTANAGQGKSMVLTYKLGPNYLLPVSYTHL